MSILTGNVSAVDGHGNSGSNNLGAGGQCDGFYDGITNECVDFALDQSNGESTETSLSSATALLTDDLPT